MRISVLIPTLPERHEQLARALASIAAQDRPADAVIVEPDPDATGAAATRNRALARVDTEWVAFLDDDDELHSDHLRRCARHAILSRADVIYPSYEVIGGEDPVRCDLAFDPLLLRRTNFIPVTTLCRTERVLAVGGFQPYPDRFGNPCEDWGLWLALLDAGARFSHLTSRTWTWHLGSGHHRHHEEAP